MESSSRGISFQMRQAFSGLIRRATSKTSRGWRRKKVYSIPPNQSVERHFEDDEEFQQLRKRDLNLAQSTAAGPSSEVSHQFYNYNQQEHHRRDEELEDELLDRRNIVLERHAATMDYPGCKTSGDTCAGPVIMDRRRIGRLRRSLDRISKRLPGLLASLLSRLSIVSRRKRMRKTGDSSLNRANISCDQDGQEMSQLSSIQQNQVDNRPHNQHHHHHEQPDRATLVAHLSKEQLRQRLHLSFSSSTEESSGSISACSSRRGRSPASSALRRIARRSGEAPPMQLVGSPRRSITVLTRSSVNQYKHSSRQSSRRTSSRLDEGERDSSETEQVDRNYRGRLPRSNAVNFANLDESQLNGQRNKWLRAENGDPLSESTSSGYTKFDDDEEQDDNQIMRTSNSSTSFSSGDEEEQQDNQKTLIQQASDTNGNRGGHFKTSSVASATNGYESNNEHNLRLMREARNYNNPMKPKIVPRSGTFNSCFAGNKEKEVNENNTANSSIQGQNGQGSLASSSSAASGSSASSSSSSSQSSSLAGPSSLESNNSNYENNSTERNRPMKCHSISSGRDSNEVSKRNNQRHNHHQDHRNFDAIKRPGCGAGDRHSIPTLAAASSGGGGAGVNELLRPKLQSSYASHTNNNNNFERQQQSQMQHHRQQQQQLLRQPHQLLNNHSQQQYQLDDDKFARMVSEYWRNYEINQQQNQQLFNGGQRIKLQPSRSLQFHPSFAGSIPTTTAISNRKQQQQQQQQQQFNINDENMAPGRRKYREVEGEGEEEERREENGHDDCDEGEEEEEEERIRRQKRSRRMAAGSIPSESRYYFVNNYNSQTNANWQPQTNPQISSAKPPTFNSTNSKPPPVLMVNSNKVSPSSSISSRTNNFNNQHRLSTSTSLSSGIVKHSSSNHLTYNDQRSSDIVNGGVLQEIQQPQQTTTSKSTSIAKQPTQSRQRVVLQASTSELMSCLADFIQIKCPKLAHFNTDEALQWLREVDRSLLCQGWQEIAFINPANVVFLYMLLRELIDESLDDENDLQMVLMTSLYLSYAYMGNEISYPLQPFLCEQDNHVAFWDRTMYIINLLSSQMLRLNAQPSFFAEVFSELKNYQYMVKPPRPSLPYELQHHHHHQQQQHCQQQQHHQNNLDLGSDSRGRLMKLSQESSHQRTYSIS